MEFRVTARFAQRFGTIAPSQTSGGQNKRAFGSNACSGWLGMEVPLLSTQRCKTKCAVAATLSPASTAWNWLRVFSRCTTRRRISPALLQIFDTTDSHRQALAALGAARIDNGATTPCLHADQKAMGAGPANFGGLVSAFHFGNPGGLGFKVTQDYRYFSQSQQDLAAYGDGAT